MKLFKLKSFATSLGKYELWGNKNKVELRKLLPNLKTSKIQPKFDTIELSTKAKNYNVIREKKYTKNSIIRTQFDENTGEQIGQSIVHPNSKNYNGSIIINDKSVSMKNPFLHRDGIIGKRELLSKHDLEILDYENQSPILQRFLKMVSNSYNAMKK
jgi:hypothetical protein